MVILKATLRKRNKAFSDGNYPQTMKAHNFLDI